jgi:hypothetical protein
MTKGEAIQAILALPPGDFEDAMAALIDACSPAQRADLLRLLEDPQ